MATALFKHVRYAQVANLLRRLASFALTFALLASVFIETPHAANLSQDEKQQIDRSIHLLATYLSAQIKQDGRFEYRRHIDPEVTLQKRYNMLRHAGAIYALAQYSRYFKDEQVLQDTGRAVHNLRKVSLAQVGDRSDLLAIWSHPEITGSRKPLTAKLGGAGLALVAMIACGEVNCAETAEDELQKLGRFILFLQRDDGSFFSKYTPSEGGKRGDWVSLYYPGEAALGLIKLFEIRGEKKWLDAAYKALHRLAQDRRYAESVPADHWALLATERIWSHISTEQQSLLRSHGRQIIEQILSEQVVNDDPAFDGGFTPDGRTTPTATRLEGLLAAYTLFPKDDSLRRDIENAVMIGVDFLMSAQMAEGPLAGGIPRGTKAIEQPKNAEEDAFNRRVGEVRIDYVQHALSALLQMRAAFMID